MKWDIWVQPNQIFNENYPDGWSHADVERAANNRYGGKVTTVSPAPSRSSEQSYSGGGGSSSGGGGCLPLFGLIALVVIGGVFAGGDSDSSSPAPERSYSAPVERVAPAAPEPQFKDYASPPPSYCITENFEPC